MFFQVAEAPQPQRGITYGNQGEDEVGMGRGKWVENTKKGVLGREILGSPGACHGISDPRGMGFKGEGRASPAGL